VKRRPRGTAGARPSTAPSTTAGSAVFLVGFMGAGKTSVGRTLARLLNWEFEDLDDRIQLREGRTVAEIFRSSGEQGFRRAEKAALRELIEEVQTGSAKIVALGGGAFVQKANAARLKAAGVPTVFLDAAVEELWERCSKQATESGTERPLLGSRERFSALYEKRRRSYLAASVRVGTGGRRVEVIAQQIADTLGLKKQ
jgi:shikimate kinase